MTVRPIEHQDAAAASRLARLDLRAGQLTTAALRADAEAKLCTDLDPTNMEGMTRWAKFVRFLREELLVAGWDYDNSTNFCRTIHPSEAFAIVVSSGDVNTGVPLANPSTKYRKGETAVRAVEHNGQGAFDLGEGFEVDEQPDDDKPDVPVWYLLYRVTQDAIFLELSFPKSIEAGLINEWTERIILDPIDRQAPPTIEDTPDTPQDGDDSSYSVVVERR